MLHPWRALDKVNTLRENRKWKAVCHISRYTDDSAGYCVGPISRKESRVYTQLLSYRVVRSAWNRRTEGLEGYCARGALATRKTGPTGSRGSRSRRGGNRVGVASLGPASLVPHSRLDGCRVTGPNRPWNHARDTLPDATPAQQDWTMRSRGIFHYSFADQPR